MYKLYPYYTNDGSTGLFSPDADDIYHSTYGALTEAFEKFILPADIDKFLKENNEIKILDICFGIGYNSKSLINKILDFVYYDTIYTDNTTKTKYTEKIDTNNNINNNYNDKLYTNNNICKNLHDECSNNKKLKVYIHAIDTDKNLAFLSPFFITDKKRIKNNKIPVNDIKIEKMISKKFVQKFKLHKEVDILLLKSIFNQIDSDAENLLFKKEYSPFFDKYMKDLYSHFKNDRSNNTPLQRASVFLHNIYYKYISARYKKAVKALKLLDFNFKLDIEDARQVIKKDNDTYNFIFLDAFTPAKCPCLWSIDFFKELYKRLDNNGMILTYSNSVNIRNAFLNAGFYVGKIYSDSSKKFMGTVAVKNKSLIKNELSEYDLGLMKTRAGIFYRDEDLTLDNEAIIKQHEIDVKNSTLISSSKYIKMCKSNKS